MNEGNWCTENLSIFHFKIYLSEKSNANFLWIFPIFRIQAKIGQTRSRVSKVFFFLFAGPFFEMAAARFWSEDHSSFTDILKDKDFTVEDAHTLAEAYFSDHVMTVAGIVMPEETETDPDVFYDGALICQWNWFFGISLLLFHKFFTEFKFLKIYSNYVW